MADSKYNPEKLKESCYGLAGCFFEKLRELVTTKQTPIGFYEFAEMYKSAIPYFPEREQLKHKLILIAGLDQAKYFEAQRKVDDLKDGEHGRLEVIMSAVTNPEKFISED
jgi:hypothetical protein